MFFFDIFSALLGLLIIPLAILAVLAAWWTFKDASSRNFNPLLWAGISFFVFPLGFLIYLGYITIKGKNEV